MAKTLIEKKNNGANEIDAGNLIAIHFNKIKIHPKTFISKDHDKKREGFIKFDVGGQSTVMKFEEAEDGKDRVVSDKFRNKIAYFGTMPSDLGISVTLVELDEKERAEIGKVKTAVDSLAKLPVNSFNPYIGPGLCVLSTLLKLWEVNIDDDLEAQAHYVFDHSELIGKDPLRCVFTRSNCTVFEIEFSISDLGKQGEFKNLIISIGKPKFDINLEGKDKDFISSIFDLLPDLKKKITEKTLSTFTFQASSGKQTDSVTTPYIKQYEDIVNWEMKQLFVVPATEGKKSTAPKDNKHIVPLSFSFALFNKDFHVQEILDVVESSLDLAAVLETGGKKSEELKKLMKKENDNVISFMAELSKHNLSLFSFNGLVFLSPDETEDLECSNGTITLKKVQKSEDLWRGTINKKKIHWKNKEIGTFSCLLEIKGIKP
jgi:hypothetical protein